MGGQFRNKDAGVSGPSFNAGGKRESGGTWRERKLAGARPDALGGERPAVDPVEFRRARDEAVAQGFVARWASPQAPVAELEEFVSRVGAGQTPLVVADQLGLDHAIVRDYGTYASDHFVPSTTQMSAETAELQLALIGGGFPTNIAAGIEANPETGGANVLGTQVSLDENGYLVADTKTSMSDVHPFVQPGDHGYNDMVVAALNTKFAMREASEGLNAEWGGNLFVGGSSEVSMLGGLPSMRVAYKLKDGSEINVAVTVGEDGRSLTPIPSDLAERTGFPAPQEELERRLIARANYGARAFLGSQFGAGQTVLERTGPIKDKTQAREARAKLLRAVDESPFQVRGENRADAWSQFDEYTGAGISVLNGFTNSQRISFRVSADGSVTGSLQDEKTGEVFEYPNIPSSYRKAAQMGRFIDEHKQEFVDLAHAADQGVIQRR